MVIMETHSDKKTKGRQKIEIKRIQAKSNLQVTFSKRRAGLVKKASELSLLCGAEVAVLAFSPGGKVFAFGHPNMDAVLNRYLNSEEVDNSVDVTSSSSTSLQVQHWNNEYEEALKELEEEKRRLALIQQWNKICENDVNAGFWWDHELIESMGLEELDEHVAALQQLKINVASRVKSQLLLANNNNNNNNNTDFDNQNMGIGDADFGGLGFGNGLF